MKTVKSLKFRVQGLPWILILLSAFLIGCAHLSEYSQNRRRLSAISAGNLKGLDKIEIIKEFGQPLSVSKSELSESWYYAKPCEIWIWFEEGKVERWQAK